MTTPNSSNGPEGTIPVAEAIELTSNWRTYLTEVNPAFAAHSFFVPIIDFVNILKYNPTAEGVRVSLGLENSNDPTSAKLVLVPVSNGEDVVYLQQDNGVGEGSNVFDMTIVCPPVCPVRSVLNQ